MSRVRYRFVDMPFTSFCDQSGDDHLMFVPAAVLIYHPSLEVELIFIGIARKKHMASARWRNISFYSCSSRSSGSKIWTNVNSSWWPIAWPTRSTDLTSLNYFLWGHMKSLVYKTPADSKEDLLAHVMAAAAVGVQGMVIECTRTWYVGAVYALKSLVVTSSPSCKWTQKKNNVQ